MGVVYFVYAIFDDKEIPAGVWQPDLRDVCFQFKKGWGTKRSMLFSSFDKCVSI
jgi:hypothetical protein